MEWDGFINDNNGPVAPVFSLEHSITLDHSAIRAPPIAMEQDGFINDNNGPVAPVFSLEHSITLDHSAIRAPP